MIKISIYFFLFWTTFLSAQNLVSDLHVYDQENAADWSIQTNLQPGDIMFGDRTYTLVTIPEKYRGFNWIRTANDSKDFSNDTLVTLLLTDSANI